MLAGLLALVAAALFSGAALYITVAEQPARLMLDAEAMLKEWMRSYRRAAFMQASLAIIGFLLAALAWRLTLDIRWLLGGFVLLANWPYTMFVVAPVNKALNDADPAEAGPATRGLVIKWGRLHAVRIALGFAAAAIFVWAGLG